MQNEKNAISASNFSFLHVTLLDVNSMVSNTLINRDASSQTEWFSSHPSLKIKISHFLFLLAIFKRLVAFT